MLMRTHNHERGATALFIALTMLVLMGVAAVAVDLSRGWNERRQDQTSVDISAVAGALSFGAGTNAIADEVMDSARTNLDTTYSNADWDDLWTSCVGPPPAGFTPAPSSIGAIDCIGLNPSFVWVRVPDQITETTFGKIVGVDEMSTDAEVIVTLIGEGSTGALPFAIEGNLPPGEMCMDAAPLGHTEPPCDGPSTGSFGNIAPQMFGNEDLGTSQWCRNNPGTPTFDNVAQSIAMGIDHALFPYPPPFDAATWNENGDETHKDLCNETSGFVAEPADGVPINTVFIDTGNYVQGEITEGLITGGTYPDGGGPRLTRTGANTRTVLGVQVDDNPVWKYLFDESSHGILECDGTTIRGLATIADKNDAMQDCFDAYPASGGPQLFSDNILETPRLGVAPRLWHNDLPTGFSEPRPIQTFETVFIHGIWLKEPGPSGTVPFFPDDGASDLSSAKAPIQQATAYLFDDSMISDAVHTALGGITNDTWQPEIYQ